ncbi:MAG: choice-of-anchor D domain-containing protein [Myxococcota bacterium]
MWALLACATPDEESPAPVAEDCEPTLVVEPLAVDFGEVAVGSAATAEVTLSNPCDETYTITTVEQSGSGTFEVAEVSPMLGAGESRTIAVTYAPGGTLGDEGSLRLDDTWVTLSGTGVSPTIALDPAELRFGPVLEGCTAEASLGVANAGNADLLVTEVRLDDFNGDFAAGVVAPVTLAVGESLVVPVSYTANHTGSATLTFVSNDATAPEASVLLAGERADLPVHADTFTNPDGFDLLVSLDVTESMAGEIDDVSDNLRELVDTLRDEALVPWQIAVVTQDDGCVTTNVPFVDATTSDDDLRTRLAVWTGAEADAGAEQGFDMVENALSTENLAGCNAGMMRPDAALQILRVTNDDEESATTTSDFHDRMLAVDETVRFHAVSGPTPDGCMEWPANTSWWELASLTGGLSFSICEPDPWHDDLAATFDLDGPGDTYALTETPEPDTIVVTVDRIVTTRWTYDADANAVVFDERSVPGPGTEVEVLYTIVGWCE